MDDCRFWELNPVMFVMITTNVVGHEEYTEDLELECNTGGLGFLEKCEGYMTEKLRSHFHILK